MRLTAGITLLTFVLAMGSAWAEECAYRDGGYCVSDIASQITKKIESPKEPEIFGGPSYLNYYESVWNQMVVEGKATAMEREKSFEEAWAAGGTKIGGVNLVVLSAWTLRKLVDLKLLTLEQAQEILNSAKGGQKL